MITQDDVHALVAEVDAGRQRWISGALGSNGAGAIEQDRDMTRFGPFGGEAVRGTVELAGRQARAVSRFRGGRGRTELVKSIIVGEIVVLVLIERNQVTFEGLDTEHPWVLRVTEVFERRGDR